MSSFFLPPDLLEDFGLFMITPPNSGESLLPSNAAATERAMESTVSRLGELPVLMGGLWDPYACPAGLLPWLAWALSVDEWRVEWSENMKRDVIAAAIQTHVRKGTVWSLRQALAAAGYSLSIVEEWFEVGGDPYTGAVNIHLYSDGLEDDDWTRLIFLINAYRNVRSHIELRVYQILIGPLNLTSAARIGEVITVFPLT